MKQTSSVLLLCVLFALFAECMCDDYAAFERYRRSHGRRYAPGTAEYDTRFKIFQQSLREIESLNKANSLSGSYGLTDFADRTSEELPWSSESLVDINEKGDVPFVDQGEDITEEDMENFPREFNWCDKGFCAPIRYQGNCGSCYAFAAAAGVEIQTARKTHGPAPNISVQAIIDCLPNSRSCCGDAVRHTLTEMRTFYDEADYPYEAYFQKMSNCTVRSCRTSGLSPVAHMNGFEVASMGWRRMFFRIFQRGPLVTGMFVPSAIKHYHAGSPPLDGGEECKQAVWVQNHYITVVGYGFMDGVPYYLAKNSWGDWWGDRGFFKIRADNPCGIGLRMGSPSQPLYNCFQVSV